eukprot:CAMPEP_0174266916 /NCGR_PEP_ID=MMETSP0439-20130205/31902_1 /TAXON_ID=0 /ORGANISM="Stereomyxa ramosa, Strain Chinc5" /LENGTH=193 /DNA_ID=CAMNT_0015354165 /DNA_START=887 /DNA_END=1468 /DNA_ORIENTATION=+
MVPFARIVEQTEEEKRKKGLRRCKTGQSDKPSKSLDIRPKKELQLFIQQILEKEANNKQPISARTGAEDTDCPSPRSLEEEIIWKGLHNTESTFSHESLEVKFEEEAVLSFMKELGWSEEAFEGELTEEEVKEVTKLMSTTQVQIQREQKRSDMQNNLEANIRLWQQKQNSFSNSSSRISATEDDCEDSAFPV